MSLKLRMNPMPSYTTIHSALNSFEIASPSFWQGASASRSVSAGTYESSIDIVGGNSNTGGGYIVALIPQ
jgi:hypothetical protein